MAKRKTKRSGTRRRRVSGVGALNAQNLLTTIGATLGGVVAAGYLNKLALSGRSNTIQAAVPIAVGLFLPKFVKGTMGQFAGAGFIAYGGTKFLQNMGLAGLGDVMDFPVSISGDGDVSVIAGPDDFAMAGDGYGVSVLAGDDLMDQD
jgi:hypothetical protein